MSNEELQQLKNRDNLADITLSPRENHLLVTIARMGSVPTEFEAPLHEALDKIEATPVTREVVELFIHPQNLGTATDQAHDVYTYFNLWAGNKIVDKVKPQFATAGV